MPRDDGQTSIFVSEYPSNWKSKDLFDLFNRKVGNVDRIDMKDDNYSFVIFKEPADATEAVKIMDAYDTGSTTLRVELARGDQKKRKNQTVKTKVLFVVNFDKETTTERDIYDFLAGFDVEKVDMWRGGKNISSKNYCFVTMADEEAAADAQEALDGRYLGDRQVTVELKAGRDKMADRDRRGGGDRDRSRDRDRVRSGGGDRRDVDRDRSSKDESSEYGAARERYY